MFAVGKAPGEILERNEINRIKIELKQEFKDQTFHVVDLQYLYPGESELTVLTPEICLEKVHVNLIYAFADLYREQCLHITRHDGLSFRIKS